jgi:micrococcal nuclease
MYFGKEASDFATKLALGKQVTIYLEKEKKPRDKYHRLLAYIQLSDGTFLNEILLSEGYAYADLRFKHGLYNKYKQLESVARSQKKGLWANVTPEQMPKWRQKRLHLTTPDTETAEVNN